MSHKYITAVFLVIFALSGCAGRTIMKDHQESKLFGYEHPNNADFFALDTYVKRSSDIANPVEFFYRESTRDIAVVTTDRLFADDKKPRSTITILTDNFLADKSWPESVKTLKYLVWHGDRSFTVFSDFPSVMNHLGFQKMSGCESIGAVCKTATAPGNKLRVEVMDYRKLIGEYNQTINLMATEEIGNKSASGNNYRYSIPRKSIKEKEMQRLIDFESAIAKATSQSNVVNVSKFVERIGIHLGDTPVRRINQLKFAESRSHFLVSASSAELDKFLEDRSSHLGLPTESINEVETRRNELVRDVILASNSIEEVAAHAKRAPSDHLVKKHLLNLYRGENKFPLYLRAYDEYGDRQDLISAQRIAKSQDELKLIEYKIVKTLKPETIFDVKLVSSSESKIRTQTQSQLLSAMKGTVKDIGRTLRVSAKNIDGFRLSHGEYKIRAKIRLNFDYSVPIEGKDKDYREQIVVFTLNKNNAWSSQQSVDYRDIPVTAKYRLAVTGFLSFVGNLFGQNVSRDDMDIETHLRSVSTTYEILDIL